MSEDKIQDTKEALLKFSKITTLSDMEQTILRNGANAINQLQKGHNILTEFEKWLEEKINYWEQQEEIWINEGFMKFGGEANNKIIYKGCLDKLQELKEGKK